MGLLAWFKEKSAQNDKKNDKTPTIVSPNEDVQTVFSMDYITTPCGKYQNVMVEFPKSSIWKILINNEPQRYYPGEYSEGGWSADHKYRKVFADDFVFWVSPNDYSAFINLMNDLKARYARDKEERKESYRKLLQEYQAGIQTDSVDDDIRWCYFESPNGFLYVDDERKFHSLATRIAKICEKSGGRLYKTRAKSAKVAILVSPSARKQDNVDRLREMGYKVVTLEDAVKFWKLEKYWDIATAESRYQEFIQDLSNSSYLR